METDISVARPWEVFCKECLVGVSLKGIEQQMCSLEVSHRGVSWRGFPVRVSGNRCPWQCTPAWMELDDHTSHIRIISVEAVVALC